MVCIYVNLRINLVPVKLLDSLARAAAVLHRRGVQLAEALLHHHLRLIVQHSLRHDSVALLLATDKGKIELIQGFGAVVLG